MVVMLEKNFVSQKNLNYIRQLKNYAKQKSNNKLTLLIRLTELHIDVDYELCYSIKEVVFNEKNK